MQFFDYYFYFKVLSTRKIDANIIKKVKDLFDFLFNSIDFGQYWVLSWLKTIWLQRCSQQEASRKSIAKKCKNLWIILSRTVSNLRWITQNYLGIKRSFLMKKNLKTWYQQHYFAFLMLEILVRLSSVSSPHCISLHLVYF